MQYIQVVLMVLLHRSRNSTLAAGDHLVFRADRNIGGSQTLFDLWTLSKLSPGMSGQLPPAYFNLSAPISAFFKSPIVELRWDIVTEVRWSFYTGGSEVMWYTFKPSGDSKVTYFNQNRVTGSSFEDIAGSSFNFFSIEGHAIHLHKRRWFINKLYNGCPGDSGWSLVLDTDHPIGKSCPWENRALKPSFLYQPGSKVSYLQDVIEAEVFITTVKMDDSQFGGECVSSCMNRQDGVYQSCLGCNVFLTCHRQVLRYKKCPLNQIYDHTKKKCDSTSTTCKGLHVTDVSPLPEADTCNKIPADPNGLWTDDCIIADVTLISVCHLCCNFGYHLQSVSSSYLMCQVDGHWNNTIHQCQIDECEKLPIDEHGSWSEACTYSNATFEMVCNLTCDIGYSVKLPRYEALRCEAGGAWNDTIPTCTIVICPTPTAIDKASLATDPGVYHFLAAVVYHCDEGHYVAEGDLGRTCTHSATWTGLPPICKSINCSSPEHPPYTTVLQDPAPYLYRSVLKYQCSSGYELLTGDRELTCMADGQWSGHPPVCTIPMQSGADMDDYFSLYKKLGKKVITCSGLPAVPNAAVSVSGLTFLSSVSYMCEVGYRHTEGTLTRHCLQGKTWNGSTPVCTSLSCPAPPQIANTTVSVYGTNLLDETVYSCQVGYIQVGGDRARLCNQNEVWQGNDIQCLEIICHAAPIIPHSHHIVSGYKLGSKAMYQCNSGYAVLSGTTLSYCQKTETWTTASLICKKINCGYPNSIVNTEYVTTGTFVNETAVYTCVYGYEYISGDDTRKCLPSGMWSNINIVCTAISCHEESYNHLNAVVVNQTGHLVGDVVILACKDDYTHIFGKPELTCAINKAWRGQPLTCIEIKCGEPSEIPNAVRQYTSTTYLSSVHYECQHGYYLRKGDTVHTCQLDGKWKGELPLCKVIDCGDIPTSSSDTLKVYQEGTNYDSVINFNCAEGYQLVGNNTMVCLDTGQWRGTVPTCQIIMCPQPPQIQKAKLSHTSTQHMSTALYNCTEGYKLTEGRTEIICVEGTWQGDLPVCHEIQCLSPQIVPNAGIEFSTVTVNSIVRYRCLEGYVLQGGNTTHTCLHSGEWDGVLVTCIKKQCPLPAPAINNTRWQVDLNSVDQRTLYTCTPGYESLNGSVYKYCLHSGEWSGDDLSCKAKENGMKILVVKDKEPNTTQEQIMQLIGFTKADKEPSNIATGTVGTAFLVFTGILIIVIDSTKIRRDFKRLKKNLRVFYYS